MKEYRECYIAFLDLLGFKNMINNKSCEEILEVYQKIKIHLKKIMRNGEELCNTEKLNMKIMSDSICFYIDVKEENAFLALISECIMFQKELLTMECPVLVRGAIVKGNIYAEEDITFGKGLTEAYLLEEKNAKVPRIIMLGDTIDDGLKGCIEQSKEVTKEMVFRDFDFYYSVDYIGFMYRSEKETKENGKNAKKYVESVLNKEKDSSVREKYLYLKDRLDYYYSE